jgi:hypothetical protein
LHKAQKKFYNIFGIFKEKLLNMAENKHGAIVFVNSYLNRQNNRPGEKLLYFSNLYTTHIRGRKT